MLVRESMCVSSCQCVLVSELGCKCVLVRVSV